MRAGRGCEGPAVRWDAVDPAAGNSNATGPRWLTPSHVVSWCGGAAWSCEDSAMSSSTPQPLSPAQTETGPAMGRYIDASPSPFHAVASSVSALEAAGFVEQHETEAWVPSPAGFVRRAGSLVAWKQGEDPLAGFNIVGAHTDSPNLRIKPNPVRQSGGLTQLSVEIYGGALLNSWLDRDLGLSGRVAVRGEAGVTEHLLLVSRPVLRVPQLAIHLDREIHTNGLQLNKQEHMAPLWADGSLDSAAFRGWIARELDVDATDIAGWDLMAHDLTPSALLGADNAFFAAPRIDNLASCFAGVEALVAAKAADATQVLCLFDHEEVGSVSRSGAAGSLLPTVLERIHRLSNSDGDDFVRALAASACVSADGAHATHPNYVERHEQNHQIALNGGPVIKRNANERYATDATGQAIAEQACIDAGVPFQVYVNRTDLACGSTIGPVTAARLGIPTVDFGMPQLSMHSAREMCGASDPAHMVAALTSFFGR